MSKGYYDATLNEEGIAATRVEDLAEAMDKLHYALRKCDYANRRKFFDKSIETRLKDYAVCAQMSDVTDIGKITGKASYCYHAPKDNKGIRIEIIRENDPQRKILCGDFINGETGAIRTFPTWDAACIYSMKKNLENGLLADDVTKIIESANKTGKTDRNVESSPSSQDNESLLDKVQFALDKLALELRQEKTSRGMDLEEVNKVPLLVLAQKTSNELHAYNSASAKKNDYPSKTILLLEDVTSALIASKIKEGMSVEDALKVPVIEKVESLRIEYYGLNKVFPPVVRVQKDQDGEYRVPGPEGKEEAAAYYTDDKKDAIGTAKAMYGADTIIKFKTVEQHISKEDNKPAVEVPVKAGRSKR